MGQNEAALSISSLLRYIFIFTELSGSSPAVSFPFLNTGICVRVLLPGLFLLTNSLPGDLMSIWLVDLRYRNYNKMFSEIWM